MPTPLCPDLPTPPDSAWASALRRALHTPGEPRLVFQPIVDLQEGVVAGYEALSRFAGPPHAPPDAWYAAAGRLGLGGHLEAVAVRAALEVLPELPPGRFLTVNVSPHLLTSPPLAAVFAGRHLSGLVVELTEHLPIETGAALRDALAGLRRQGALVALDDTGSGYAGLQQLTDVRPELVKLDRSLVSGMDRDEAKLVLAEMLGAASGRLDAWVLAEGIERAEELDAAIRLGMPLGQGFLLGVPLPCFAELPADLSARIRMVAARRSLGEVVASLVEQPVTLPASAHPDRVAACFATDPGLDPIVLVGPAGGPEALVRRREDGGVRLSVPLRVQLTEGPGDVAARAMTRPAATRFDPVVAITREGRLAGLVRVERLVASLVGAQPLSSSAAALSPSAAAFDPSPTVTPAPRQSPCRLEV